MFASRVISKAAPLRAAASRATAVNLPRRGMAAGGPPPQYTGIEAQVRAVFPKDEQLVVAILGFYAGLYFVSSGVSAMFSKPKKAPEAPGENPSAPGRNPAAPVAPPLPGSPEASSSSDIPTGDEFWAWLDGPGNLEKVLAKIEESK